MQAFATRRWWLDATEIRTERLVLRAISPADAAALGHAMWAHRDHLTPWIDVPGIPLSELEWRRRTRRNAAAFVRGAQLLYAVRRTGDDRLLGCIALTPTGATCELSYWLVPAGTGRGYAREAAAALARLAYRYAGACAARIRCRADNVRSAAVARALGALPAVAHGGVQEWTLIPELLCATGRVVAGRPGQRLDC
jgi:RimJ/RimL family protein N-acetyltransferase